MNPTVVLAMTEIGWDLGDVFAKLRTDDLVQAADVVITIGDDPTLEHAMFPTCFAESVTLILRRGSLRNSRIAWSRIPRSSREGTAKS